MGRALIAAALTGLCTGVGALPFFFMRELPRRAYDGILGLGSGLMLAAATLGLLAEAVRDVHVAGVDGPAAGRLALVVAGFAAGVAIAAAMDRLIPHRHARGHRQHLENATGSGGAYGHAEARRGYAVVGALTLHRIPEGLAIGAGFAVGGAPRLGILLALTVGIQNACEGVVMGAPLRQGGLSAGRSLLVVTLTGLATPVAALAGFGLSSGALRALPFILALAGGTLIYVTSNEIIPESHSHGHEGTASAGLVAGFLLTMVLQALLHGSS